MSHAPPRDEDELLLRDEEKRFVLFPLRYPHLYDLYAKARDAHWTVAEVNLSADIDDWRNRLSDNERHFIEHVLAFFAASDGIVMENLILNFLREIKVMEASGFYLLQGAMEFVHAEMYAKLIETYIQDAKHKQELFDAIETMEAVQMKAEWAMKWFDPTRPFAERLIAFACVEGVFFSGSFCAIYWLKKRKLMPGLTFSNELISRDEGLHCDFACALYAMLKGRVTEERVHEIFAEAMQIEFNFISKSLPVDLIGMNAGQMHEYLRVVANRLLAQLGYEPLYPGATIPFSFMDLISAEGKTNFFERKTGEYAKMQVVNEAVDYSGDNDDF